MFKRSTFIFLSILIAMMLLGSVASRSQAGVFEVGAGKPYGTIQSAVDAANNGDTVRVFAGVYSETVKIRASEGLIAVTVEVNPGDKVVLVGEFKLEGIDSLFGSDTYVEGTVIDGFWIDKRDSVTSGISTNFARNNTFRNLVIFGNDTNSKGIFCQSSSGVNVVEKSTLFGLTNAYTSNMSGGVHVHDSIIVNSHYKPYNYPSTPGDISYSCFYANPDVPNLPDYVADSTGVITVAPDFIVDDDPNHPYFLLLDGTSSPCVGSASDGGNMGGGGVLSTRHVGSGFAYSTIQAAVDASSSGDVIVVHEGVYAERVVVDSGSAENLLIKAVTGENVVVIGGFALVGTSGNLCNDNIIRGFFVTADSDIACYSDYGVSNTWKDLTVYGCGAAAFGGQSMSGGDQIVHCTVYDCALPGDYGVNSGATVKDSIIAFCDAGWSSGGTSYHAYTCWYENPVGSAGNESMLELPGSEGSSLVVDPVFVSTDSSIDTFMMLGFSSPCTESAGDGLDMGAFNGHFTEAHVGSGYEFSTIQGAVDSAHSGDTIIVHEGVYSEQVSVNALPTYDPCEPTTMLTEGKANLTLRAHPGDTVQVLGSINLVGGRDAAEVWVPAEYNLVEGFYVTPTSSAACVSNNGRNNTWRNIVIHNGAENIAGFYGYMMYGSDDLEKCVVYNCYSPGSYGYASSARITDCVFAFNETSFSSSGTSAYRYTCWWENPEGSFGDEASTVVEWGGYEGSSIFVDPDFLQTEAYCPSFLWLNSDTSMCVDAAMDGENMGGRPDGTESECVEDPDAVDDPDWTFMYVGHGWPTDEAPSGPYGGFGEPIETPEWAMTNYYGYGEPVQVPGEAYFRIRTSTAGYLYYTKTDNDPQYPSIDFDFSVGATVETRLKLYADGEFYTNGGCSLTVRDETGYVSANWQGNPGDPDSYSIRLMGGTIAESKAVDTTKWHTYRLTVIDDIAALYVDGVILLTATVNPSVAANGAVYWGDTSSGGATYAYWDYIKVYCDGAVPESIPEVLSINPASGGTLCRERNNVIEIVNEAPIVLLSSTPLRITEIGTDVEVGAEFNYELKTTTVGNDTLVAVADGQVLKNLSWYRVEPQGAAMSPFQADLAVVAGDISNDRIVDFGDYSLLSVWMQAADTLDRFDLNGDGQVDLGDLAVLAGAWLDQGSENPWVEVSFSEYAGNPVLTYGTEPSGLNTIGVLHCCVRRKDSSSPYLMWYTGDTSSARAIYLASSSDGLSWTKQGLVLSEPGQHTHTPCVIWDESAGLWKMWYGAGSPYSIYYATSADGVAWTKYTNNPVFTPASNPSDWDASSVRSPAVIYDTQAGEYKMWYWGNNDSSAPGTYGEFGTGLATSSDGIGWTRVGQVSDESTLITNDVIQVNGVFYSFHNIGPHLGYAVSLDGMSWQEDSNNPLIIAGGSGWKKSYIQAPSIVYDADAGELKMYFNGADTNLPADGTQIGLASTPFNP